LFSKQSSKVAQKSGFLEEKALFGVNHAAAVQRVPIPHYRAMFIPKRFGLCPNQIFLCCCLHFCV
jgi:hypothetical protein